MYFLLFYLILLHFVLKYSFFATYSWWVTVAYHRNFQNENLPCFISTIAVFFCRFASLKCNILHFSEFINFSSFLGHFRQRCFSRTSGKLQISQLTSNLKLFRGALHMVHLFSHFHTQQDIVAHCKYF